MKSPSILTAMTPFPRHIQLSASLGEARVMMEVYGIRHLPVESDDKIVGVISEHDLDLAVALNRSDLENLEGFCTQNPLLVDSEDSLTSVIRKMAIQGHGAAVVLRNGRLAGILTMTDVCQLLLTALNEPMMPPAGPPSPDPDTPKIA